MEGFTKKQVAEIMGLPLRSIQYYTERGLVEPEVDPGEGRGKSRKYSRKNLVEFGIIRALSHYGMAFNSMREMFFSLASLAYDVVKHVESDESLYEYSSFVKNIVKNECLVAYVSREAEIINVDLITLEDVGSESAQYIPMYDENGEYEEPAIRAQSFVRINDDDLREAESIIVVFLRDIFNRAMEA